MWKTENFEDFFHLVFWGNSIDENGQNTLPRLQIVGGNSLSTEDVKEKTTKVLYFDNKNILPPLK